MNKAFSILRTNKYIVTLLTILGYFMLIRLGRNVLTDWDECLYGQYAREMIQKGHFGSNIWNNYLDFQKPPLYSWILVLFTKLGGNEFLLRLPNVIASLILIALIYRYGKRHFSVWTARLAATLLCIAEVFIIYSMKLNTDILYTTLIFGGFLLWMDEKRTYKYSVIAGILFGLATMIKGIGIVSFLGTLGLLIFLKPSWKSVKEFCTLMISFVFVAAPWHLYMLSEYGERFLKVYIQDNIVKRSKYPIEFHRERWYFYFLLVYREWFPWIGAIALYPILIFKRFVEIPRSLKKNLQKFIADEYQMIMLAAILIIQLAAITKVQTRIAWYALPLYPFLALFLGESIVRTMEALAKRFPNMKKDIILGSILFFILFDMTRLVLAEARPQASKQVLDTRYEAILQVAQQQEKKLLYLVSFGERQAREILPPTEQIDMTWVFGGNACAVYYGKKPTTYFYTVDEFKDALMTGDSDAIYMITKDDISLIEQVEKKIVFENDGFTLFRKLHLK